MSKLTASGTEHAIDTFFMTGPLITDPADRHCTWLYIIELHGIEHELHDIPVKAKIGQSGRVRERKFAMYPRLVYAKIAAAPRLLAIVLALIQSSSLTRPSGNLVS